MDYEITDENLYYSAVAELDLNLRKYSSPDGYCFSGTVAIQNGQGFWKDITGDHGPDDYVDEFGFKLI